MKKKVLPVFLLWFLVSPIFGETILHVSYDPTRGFFKAYNKMFTESFEKKTGKKLEINQSHGSSGKQARSVIDGLKADVVSLALAYDIDAISEKGKMIHANWQDQFPQHSSPFGSIILFLVRKKNPKKILDWKDLIKPGIEIITPNPKTSGGGRWNYLAAWGYAMSQNKNDEKKAFDFVKALYKNVKIYDTSSRAASASFLNREMGDVLLTWENEAYLAIQEIQASDSVEIVVPSTSIYTEPVIAIVDANVDNKNTRKISQDYLHSIYSIEAQELAAKNYYRPTNESVKRKYRHRFKELKLFTIRDLEVNWKKAHAKHFASGGLFDQMEKNR